MTQTMIEKVARSLTRSAAEHLIRSGDWVPLGSSSEAIDNHVEEYWPDAVEPARAALQALREPTNGVVEAGWRSQGDTIDGRPANKHSVDRQVAHAFTAMIDAILQEKG